MLESAKDTIDLINRIDASMAEIIKTYEEWLTPSSIKRKLSDVEKSSIEKYLVSSKTNKLKIAELRDSINRDFKPKDRVIRVAFNLLSLELERIDKLSKIYWNAHNNLGAVTFKTLLDKISTDLKGFRTGIYH